MENEKQQQISEEEWHEMAVEAKENCEYHYCNDHCILFDYAKCPAVTAEEYESW